ncbi:hypothetical protein MASR2M39_32110 [Ignavibacteriales bacterium]
MCFKNDKFYTPVKTSNYFFLLIIILLGSALHGQSIDSLLSILPKTNEKEKPALLAQISYHFKDRDPSQGLVYAASAVKLAKAQGDFLAEGTAYSSFAINYINLNNYDSAVSYALKAKELGEKHKISALLGDANNYIGLVFYFLGNAKQSTIFYAESLRQRKIENNPDKLSKIYNNLSLAYRMSGDLKQAESLLRISIELKRQLKDELSLARSFSNLAFFYRQKKDFETGLKYLDTALALCEKNKYEGGKADCYDNYANIYFDKGEINKAIATINKVIEIYRNAKDIRGECQGLLKLAGYDKHLKNYDAATEKLLEVTRLAAKLKLTHLMTRAYIELFYVYKLMGDIPASLKYAELLISKRDSLFTGSIYNNVLIKGIEYEIRMKDKEIKNLSEKQELLDLQNSRKFMIVLVIAVIFFLLLITFIVIYRQKRYSHKVTQDMINSITDPFMLLNANTGEVILKNQLFSKGSFKDVDFSDKINVERLNRIKNEKLPMIEEASFINSEGKEFFFNLNFYPVRGTGDSVERIVLYAANTTEIKLAEKTIRNYLQKLKASQEELKKSNESKDQLISIIGHDLRNPFVLLINIADILIDDYDIMTAEEKFKLLKDAQRTAIATHQILDNILSWTRSQSRSFSMIKEPLNLHKIVHDTILSILPLAEAKGIVIENAVPRQMPEALFDKFMLVTILRNLISNSIKYTDKNGSIVINVSMNNTTHLVLKVCDTGSGMSPEAIDQLLYENFVTSQPGTNNERGTGLGLLLVKGFLKQNGSTLKIESAPGKGTCVIFDLEKKRS